jgi:hypothetical protein
MLRFVPQPARPAPTYRVLRRLLVSLRTATFVFANGALFCERGKPINGAWIFVLAVAEVWSCCGSFLTGNLRSTLN